MSITAMRQAVEALTALNGDWDRVYAAITALNTAISEAEGTSTVGIPPGYQLVPVEPTPEMKTAASDVHHMTEAIMHAYGHLWHVNNEPMAPIPLRDPEAAAYAARKILRDMLTPEQRGIAINAIAEAIRKGETV